MFIATLDTAHFEFVALGNTFEQATQALREGWLEHGNQYEGVDRGYIERAIADGDVRVLRIGPGECARDGSVISV